MNVGTRHTIRSGGIARSSARSTSWCAGFERRLELFEIDRRYAEPDAGRFRFEVREQLRQQPDETRVDDAEAERPRRRRGIEGAVPCPQHRRVVE
jgi:hypothetical protein